MKILAVGINHRTSPIEIREKFHLSLLERELLISEFKNDPSVASVVILSTCNRCEIYATVVEDCPPSEIIQKLFCIKHQPQTRDLQKMFYVHEGPGAAEHFLRVACGLDSLILGEKQILGQIKEAIGLSRQNGMMDKTLNILTNFVMETGKKARQETQIDFGGVSVSAAAVSMAQNLLGSLEGKSVLVIGSGKMGCLALNYLRQKKAKHIYLMNRTEEKAAVIAEEFQAQSVPFWDLKEVLTRVDVCICSSGAPHYLITRDLMENVVKSRTSPLICIDISMPRNIDPQAARTAGVRLISLDDLDKVIEQNVQKRRDAVKKVEPLIARKTEEFYKAILKVRLMDSRSVLRGIVFGVLAGFLLTAVPAQANLKQIKAYKEAFPEAKPKCINCHEAEKPKKDEGLHEWNDYGKAAMKLEAHPTAETFKQLGSFDDFQKNTDPAAEEKK